MSSLEGKGFKFKDSDKQAFLNSGNSDSYISVTNSNGSVLTVYSNYNSNTGDSTVNGFEAKLSVKYDTIDGWQTPQIIGCNIVKQLKTPWEDNEFDMRRFLFTTNNYFLCYYFLYG